MSVPMHFGQGFSLATGKASLDRALIRKFHQYRYIVTKCRVGKGKHWGVMQVDLEEGDDGAQVARLPRFQQAVFQGRRLRLYTIALGALAALGLVLGFFCRAVRAAIPLVCPVVQSECRVAGVGCRLSIRRVGGAMAYAGDESCGAGGRL